MILSNPQNNFMAFCQSVWQGDFQADGPDTTNAFGEAGLPDPHAFVQRYALAFLRKVVVLLHVRYGVAFHNHISTDPNANELTRLTEALGIPSFDDMCSNAVHDGLLNDSVQWWIAHLRNYGESEKISLAHPAILELIGLPKNYDTLMEETMKRRCPTTGKDVSDPML
jgi:E3 ubiquitin-protein ligase UBR1